MRDFGYFYDYTNVLYGDNDLRITEILQNLKHECLVLSDKICKNNKSYFTHLGIFLIYVSTVQYY